MRPGIEPGNSTLKGWCLYQFVQRTMLVLLMGLEPMRDFSHQHLKLARLPIPP